MGKALEAGLIFKNPKRKLRIKNLGEFLIFDIQEKKSKLKTRKVDSYFNHLKKINFDALKTPEVSGIFYDKVDNSLMHYIQLQMNKYSADIIVIKSEDISPEYRKDTKIFMKKSYTFDLYRFRK